ncbi:bifunctional 4-hydroxy-2-oxoglutarate aldolase/2-dehydro-3-deoxy-phosphogluconate aldolase [Neolewinella antarctica]|uniref:2-dehydro-3-deoxyphosphogluconate aldolase/(4S)-4-hydroxy-2-oxoglutarate aldolase n=1 Tax=Neolewinella antarctica TaxID=442734 RepID=A0ABX0XCU8_9BACT|nr:bifunctional 4-hydroxy-2-oxoglutarate aldolase/2-dehydro-3-deoxy-phosphogluconate aldolase [Neolewinella antarctica]NJC26900.1 2-dehydro-3-deoxyphosphogluconate aldolase/(4S)-4-hydroxy-2-oxoglutarate aldolase [Neolewinella antarctica]
MTRLEVYSTVMNQGIVPLAYVADVDKAKKVIDAVYAGGMRSFEFTNRGIGAHKVFDVVAEHCRANYPDLALGIGSVVDAPTAALYIQLGADFIVSPMLVEELAPLCNRRKIAWMPGCFTPSEIGRAESLGAEIVKIFPGNAVAKGFISSLLAPSPRTNVMVTGGVSPDADNLKRWFDEGAVAVGMGSGLLRKDLLANSDFKGMEALASKCIELVNEARG